MRIWYLVHDRQPSQQSQQSQAPSKLGILGSLSAKNAKLTIDATYLNSPPMLDVNR
jgi:hypothetical protein